MADEQTQVAPQEGLDTPLEPVPASVPVAEDTFIRIDPRNIMAEVARLSGQNPDFSAAVQRFGAHRERQALERVNAELADLRQQSVKPEVALIHTGFETVSG